MRLALAILLLATTAYAQKPAEKVDAVTADKILVTLVKTATNKVEMIGKVAITNAEPASYDVEWQDVFGAYYKTSVADPAQATQAVAQVNAAARVKSPVKPRTVAPVKTNLTAVAVEEIQK